MDETLRSLDELLTEKEGSPAQPLPPNHSEFQSKLEGNPHLFTSWDDGGVFESLSPNKLREFYFNLFEFIPKLRSGLEIFESGFSKLCGLELGVSFFVAVHFFVEIGRRGRRRWSSFANAANERGLKFGRWKVRQELMSPDYLPAFEYLHKWGRLYIQIRKGKCPPCEPSDFDGEAEFAGLPQKSKAVVLAAKCVFWSALRTILPDAKVTTLNIMREIVRLDPKTYEWHYTLGNWLRLDRRSRDYRSCIGAEEMQTLWETYDECEYDETEEDDDAVYRAMALLGVLQGLAELIKFRNFHRPSEAAVKFGGLRFESDKKAVEFVLEKLHWSLDGKETVCFAELIRAGEIVSSLLPPEFRDFKTAEKCFLRAWLIMPINSKVNHKLGTLYATCEELYDKDKGLTYLRRCYGKEPSNIPGAMDLLQTLLSSPSEHGDEAKGIMDKISNSSFLKENTRAQFALLRGALEFMMGNKDEAVELWATCEGPSGEPHSLSNLQKISRRFKWKERLQWDEVVAAVDDFLKRTPADESEVRVKLMRLRAAAQDLANRRRDQSRFSTAQWEGMNKRGFQNDADVNWRSTGGEKNAPVLSTSGTSGAYVPPFRRRLLSDAQNDPTSPPTRSGENSRSNFNHGNSNELCKLESCSQSASPDSWRK